MNVLPQFSIAVFLAVLSVFGDSYGKECKQDFIVPSKFQYTTSVSPWSFAEGCRLAGPARASSKPCGGVRAGREPAVPASLRGAPGQRGASRSRRALGTRIHIFRSHSFAGWSGGCEFLASSSALSSSKPFSLSSW